MYNLLEYSNNCVKTSESLWQDCRDEPDDDDDITDFESFKFRSRPKNNTVNASTVNVKIAVSLKYLSNFWRTLEMLLINCELTLHLTWSANCIIYKMDRITTLARTDTKLYVSYITLSTQDNGKQLQQLKSGFKRTINWNNINQKYQSRQKIGIWTI